MNGHTIEITSRELEDLAPGSFLLIDLRDQTAYDHGCIPGALNMDPDELMAGAFNLPADKKIVLYCKYGIISEEAALFLREKGLDACHLAQGYGRWALEAIQKEAENEERRGAIERSLT
ncbi:MAG: rhodanese-like domain-containing protein, partial [bacterium]